MRIYCVSRTDLSVEDVKSRKIACAFTVLPMWWERAGSKWIVIDNVASAKLGESTGCYANRKRVANSDRGWG